MGKFSRDKGYRGERYFVNKFKDAGLNAVRVPLSGATEFEKSDLFVEGLKAEVKVRHDGFKELYKWLEGKDILCLKADRQDGLVVLPVDKFIELLKRGK